MIENIKSKVSGIPLPQKYNKYYITKYSLPKGLTAVKQETKKKIPVRPKFQNQQLVNLRKNKKDGTFYLNASKRKKLDGFRGFKLKSWNRTDYRNMMSKSNFGKRDFDRTFYKSRSKIRSSNTHKRYHKRYDKTDVIDSSVKSVEDNFGLESTKPNIEKLKLELLNQSGNPQILSIIEKNNYNFPNISSILPNPLNIDSTVLLPRPLNFDTNNLHLNPIKSSESTYPLESPLKDPRYYSKQRF